MRLSGRSAVNAKGSTLLPWTQMSSCWSSWYSFYWEWNYTEYLYIKRDLPTHLTPSLLWGSCLTLFRVQGQHKYLYIGITLSAQDSWYHSPLLIACSFSAVLGLTVYEWFLAQLRHIWPHQLNHLHCFKQSCLLKTSEPTLPNNLETPKLCRSFTSRAAGTATTWGSHRKAEENIFSWHHCQDSQHLLHLIYQCI